MVACLALLMAAAVAGVARAAVTPLRLGEAGVVWGWGSNLWGQVGRPNLGYVVAEPEAVDLPEGVRFVEASTGYSHSIALSSTGVVYVWGEDGSGQLGPVKEETATAKQTANPEPISLPGRPEVAQVAACNRYSLVLTSDGTVLAMGNDHHGTLGDSGSGYGAHPTPLAVPVPAASMVSCGGDFGLALSRGGQVYAWGANYDGELGFEPTSREEPLPVYAPTVIPIPGRVVEISSSDAASEPEYALALTEEGEVYGWGGDFYGELGIGKMGPASYGQFGPGIEATPVKALLPPGTFVTQVSAAGEAIGHSIALTSTGEVLTWGGGVSSVPQQIKLPGGALARQVVAAGHSLFELTTGGVLYAEGDNGDDESGLGPGVSEATTPTEVQVPTGLKVAQVSGGSDQGFAILSPLVGPAPTVTAVDPSHGPAAGGNTVTVSGEGFMPGAVVMFGSQVATNVSIHSGTTLTATVPAGTGTVDVQVTLNASTSPPAAGDRYTYESTAETGGGSGGEAGDGSGSGAGQGSGGGSGAGSGGAASGPGHPPAVGGSRPRHLRLGRSAGVSGTTELLRVSNPNPYSVKAEVTEVVGAQARAAHPNSHGRGARRVAMSRNREAVRKHRGHHAHHRGSVTIASGAARIGPHARVTLRLKLTKVGRARLKASRTLKVSLRISLAARGHPNVTESGATRLVRAPRHRAR